MQEKSILVLGSIAYDYIMSFPGDFNTNLTSDKQKKIFNLAVMPDSKEINFGGTAGNISYNLSLLNCPTNIITSVGKDFTDLGYAFRIDSQNSVKFIGQQLEDSHTASCYIVNDENQNQIIIFHEGAMKKCPDISLKLRGISKESIKIASVSPDNPLAMVKWANELIEMEIPFIFDPGQMVHYFTKSDLETIIPNAYLLIGNEFEIQKIQEILETDLEGVRALTEMLIVTQGEKGSDCYWGENKEHIPICYAQTVLDTTGAGDGYRAGLLYGLYHDLPLVKACRLGAIISSKVIETVGPQNQIFTFEKIKEDYGLCFKESLEN